MLKILRTRGVDLTISVIALTTLMTEPAAALIAVPGPAGGGVLAGAAIVGAIVVAKLWRRK